MLTQIARLLLPEDLPLPLPWAIPIYKYNSVVKSNQRETTN